MGPSSGGAAEERRLADHLNLAIYVYILESSLSFSIIVFCGLLAYSRTIFMTLSAFMLEETSRKENVVMSQKNVARRPKKGPKCDVVLPGT